MIGSFYRFVLAGSFVLAFSGCSTGNLSPSDQPSGAVIQAPGGTTHSRLKDPGGDAPVRADVTQAFFVGDNLHVTVQLLARTDVQATELVVRLLGLVDGRIRTQDEQKASAIVGEDTLESGESLLFRLKIPAQDLSEYQIQVAWGKDAQFAGPMPKAGDSEKSAQVPGGLASSATNSLDSGALGSGSLGLGSGRLNSPSLEKNPLGSGESETKSLIRFRSTELEERTPPCGAPPCDKQFSIRAEIENSSQSTLTAVRFAVGIYFSVPGTVPAWRRDLEPLIEAEEVIDLGETRIEPGAVKKLKVDVDRKVPFVSGGAFLPYLRALDYKVLPEGAQDGAKE